MKNQTCQGLNPPHGSIARSGSSGRPIAVITASISAERNSIQVIRLSEAMQHLAAGEHRGKGGAAGRRRAIVAGDGQPAKREDAQRGNDAGDAEILVVLGLARLEPGEGKRKAQKSGEEDGGIVEGLGQGGEHAAEQAGQAVGADAGRAAAGGRLALAPAALEPDQQADGQRQAELEDQQFHAQTIRGRCRPPQAQEIARPGDREWWAAVRVVIKNRRWSLSVFRDARRGPFYPSEADHFLTVAPDLRRIISMAEKVWDASIGSSLTALDQLNCAAAVLDSRGCLTRRNEHAEALFGSDLTVRHGRLRAADRASDVRLQRLIEAAVSPGGSVWAEPVVVARHGSPWLLAEAMPMTSFAHDLFNGGDTLLYFTDLVAEWAPSERLLGRTFQLTAAEARLASSLAAGEGIGAASARLAISRETVRTQLRAIFAKTGTSRQAELTALLSRLH